MLTTHKQDEFLKQEKLQITVDANTKLKATCIIEPQKHGFVRVTNGFTLLSDGGDRLNLFMARVIDQEKDYLINKVKIMTKADLKDLEQMAETEAQAFLDHTQ